MALRNLGVFRCSIAERCVIFFFDSWSYPISYRAKHQTEDRSGTPLEDWDIQIQLWNKDRLSMMLFIIDTEKREAILANCQTEEERKKNG